MQPRETRSLSEARHRLLAELERERNQLLRNIETCRIRDIEHPFIGDWSLKDIVGHVATWEAEVVLALRQLRMGRRPAILDFDRAHIDEWNQEHVERKRDLNFWCVLEQLKGGRRRLLAEIEQLSDEEVAAEGSIYGKLIRSVIDHDRQHWHPIAARLAGMSGVRESPFHSVPEEVWALD